MPRVEFVWGSEQRIPETELVLDRLRIWGCVQSIVKGRLVAVYILSSIEQTYETT